MKSISASGLAEDIAGVLESSGTGPHGALFLVYALTLILTWFVSNNAAASIMYPIATAFADELNVDFKPFVMTLLFAASAAFSVPIGYQVSVDGLTLLFYLSVKV